MKIAFYSPHLSLRGTEVAMYDYAHSLGVKVVAITNPTKTNIKNQKKRYPSNESLANYVRLNKKPDIMIDANYIFSSPSSFSQDKIHLNRKSHIELARIWKNKVLKY